MQTIIETGLNPNLVKQVPFFFVLFFFSQITSYNKFVKQSAFRPTLHLLVI